MARSIIRYRKALLKRGFLFGIYVFLFNFACTFLRKNQHKKEGKSRA